MKYLSKEIIFACFVLIFSHAALFGQNEVDVAQSGNINEAILTQIGSNTALIEQSSQNLINKVILSQSGSKNIIDIDQIQLGSGNHPNVVEIVQAGIGNNVDLEQQGKGNVAILAQHGNDNIIDMLLQGRDNYSDIKQVGSGNKVVQDIVGDSFVFEVLQEGSGNEIVHIEMTDEVKKYQITQTGGMKMIITHGPIGTVTK
ncbi:MAG: hypothetical protein DWQ05_21290 [Calditrichaeota bacterium]|nr:MAG: hypothetical protein DWQ05_21290 [Calditrichota bacterium]